MRAVPTQAFYTLFMGLLSMTLPKSFLVLLITPGFINSSGSEALKFPPCCAKSFILCFLTDLSLVSSSALQSCAAGLGEQDSSTQLIHPVMIFANFGHVLLSFLLSRLRSPRLSCRAASPPLSCFGCLSPLPLHSS